ncbi:MAG: energy transducer TonB [Candidatus Cloacimonadaceae bacterium]|nr:energy transducer TonB [Candidatus Cloacimonadaceae bacterium]MDP3113389.1 energy transducer TonB [Candidatus Cloacimonadaceae bacterium]
MENKVKDWKDIANAQFGKALSLALALMLFAMMVTPNIEVRKQKFTSTQTELVDIPMEEREKIEPPETEVQIDLQILISDELSSSDDPELDAKHARLIEQFGDIRTTHAAGLGRQDREMVNFVPYDDPPVIIGKLSPEYPDFARRARVQGTVVLEVEVYKDGSIGNIRVTRSLQSGPGGLDESAINAVKKVRFQPGKSSGQPVDTTVIIPIEFKLN